MPTQWLYILYTQYMFSDVNSRSSKCWRAAYVLSCVNEGEWQWGGTSWVVRGAQFIKLHHSTTSVHWLGQGVKSYILLSVPSGCYHLNKNTQASTVTAKCQWDLYHKRPRISWTKTRADSQTLQSWSWLPWSITQTGCQCQKHNTLKRTMQPSKK